MDEKKFRETEKKYKDLKEKHTGGEINTDQVKAELKRLMVQDENGTYWMLGGKTGKWYRHDGGQWQEADPYEQVKAAEPVEDEEEAPLELDASSKVSDQEEEDYSYAAASLGSDTGSTAGEDVSESAFGTGHEEAVAGTDDSDISLGAYETNVQDTASASQGAETIDISYPSFSTETYRAPVISSEEEERLYKEVAKATERADTGKNDIYKTTEMTGVRAKDIYKATEIAGAVEKDTYKAADLEEKDSHEAPEVVNAGAKNTYEGYDAYSTFEIDTSASTESETAAKTEAADDIEKAVKAEEAAEESLDSEKYEYTLHKGKPTAGSVGPVGVIGQVDQVDFEEQEESGPPLEPGFPSQQESPDSVTCGVCKSRIPPYAVYCAFCGAHQKTLKQRTTLKPVKEEGELLIKSIKISSLLFFLGGLGLIIGVILGATYGVMKEFLIDLSPQLPMMLNESRGGWSGGLIFAAIGGIGGFIFSAVLAVIMSCIYNLIAFIFGGIRFKVKR